MKDQYDIRAWEGGFQVDELVWLYNRVFFPKLQYSGKVNTKL